MIRKEWGIAPAVFAVDRVTKILAEGIPPEGTQLIPGVLGLRYVRNTGMAFSLLSGRPWLLILLSLAVITGAALVLRHKKISRLAVIGLAGMLGGAAGNLADRIFTGSVPDMIEFLFVRFAVFNAADVGLTLGCALVMIDLLRRDQA